MGIFYSYDDMVNEKKDFVETLYHDRRNGQMIYLCKDKVTGKMTAQKSTCVMNEVLQATGTDDNHYYVSVNTFRGSKRASECVYNITSIFIDLDCHEDDPEQIRMAKARAVELLEAAYAVGELSAPTMITDTGRGFGLQYVLNASIAAQTARTAKTRSLYQKVRQSLFDKYKEVLSADPVATQPDAAVLDDSRICRLPGTYNSKAGTWCRLIGMSKIYYELHDLIQGCHLWDWKSDEEYKKEKEERERKKKERRAQLTNKKIVSFNAIRMPFLENRITQLEKLQDIRGKACTDSCREQILFIAYSAYVQIDRATAVERLQELNERFVDPLPQKELDNLIKGTDRNKTADHEGYYLLKNSYIEDKLDLTEEEVKAIGLNVGCKRVAERQVARNIKKEKREKVIGMLKQADPLTYEEIAHAAGISRRKVCMIAKEEGLMRYGKAAARAEEKAEVISIQATQAISASASVGESAKIATKYVCVASADMFSWFDYLSSSLSPVASELLALFDLASSTDGHFSSYVESFFDRHFCPSGVLALPAPLPLLCTSLSMKFYRHLGVSGCAYAFGTFLDPAKVPTLWHLFSARAQRKRARLAIQERKAAELQAWAVSDYATESPEHREGRLSCMLQYHKDPRFGVIKSSPEYQRRLDPAILRAVEITFMELERVHSVKSFSIEKNPVPVKELKSCLKSLSYKDIVVLCERMGATGTVLSMDKPFFYVLACIWKYTHAAASEAQKGRLQKEKADQAASAKSEKNKFCNFENRTYDFDIDDFAVAKAMSKILNQTDLTVDVFLSDVSDG